MLPKEASANALLRLFRRNRVVDLDALCRTLKTHARMSVFRRLKEFDYLTSFTHSSRYYTLVEIPSFDENGLWQYRGIGFSKMGTLLNTVVYLVDVADAGRTHRELEQLLRVRVHNTLLSLVREKRIRREGIEKRYFYVSVDPQRAADQVKGRRELLARAQEASVPLPSAIVIEILVEVVNGVHAWVAPGVVVKRLTARGHTVTPEQVEEVFLRYGIDPEKKRGIDPCCTPSVERAHPMPRGWVARRILALFASACGGLRRSRPLPRLRRSDDRTEDVGA